MVDASPPTPVSDLAALKALAHPRRQRILRHLGEHGPATSAMLARALDLNTGATSYHLRELERFGFVEEHRPADAHGRERWWNKPHQDLRFPPRSEQDSETRAVMDELTLSSFARAMEEFRQSQQETPSDSRWSDAFPFSDGAITVTVEELSAFFEDYIALLKRYQRDPDESSEEVRTVATRFFAYPSSPEPGPEDPSESVH